MKTIPELAKQYPEAARQILELFLVPGHRAAATALLGSCTCTNDLFNCTCPPEYSSPKRANYSGHTPQKRTKK